MKVVENTPMWVKLAYASVPSRKMALWLVLASALFTFYCLPLGALTHNALLDKWFVINDWSWVAMMTAMTAWYWLALKWVDKNQAWES
jgi:hypothetical protein